MRDGLFSRITLGDTLSDRGWIVIAVSATTLFGLSVSFWARAALDLGLADPVSQVENVNVGALAYRAGLGRDPAMALHWLSVVLAVLAWLVLSLRRSSVTGYMATIVVAQLVSPILWDHYAVVLLVPVAWLLSRGLWWAAGVPLLSPSLLGASVPAFVYAVAFWGTLLALSLPRLSRATNT